MPPASRITDMQVCPMVDVLVPHVGGPIIGPGAPTVLIGEMPASCEGDMAVCVGPPATIVLGLPVVLIEGRPATFLGSMTDHGGDVITGFPMVEIG
ncbi:MAG: PAAR domain-containing protein [Pirellulaceae bacterium]